MNPPGPGLLSLVPFVSVDHMMRIVWDIGVERMIVELAGYIEEDFRRWELFDKTPRIAAHSAEGVIELMPTSDGATYGFKYVNGHPKNARAGRQTVTAFGVLSHVDSGYPMLISEMTILTALRTAATSALAAKTLAPPGARTMAIIGNGAQCEFQAVAFKALCGVETVRLYDIDPPATRKAAANLAGSGLAVVPCASSEEAILGAGIVTTCTADKRNATILTDNMIGAGVHLNAIGGDSPGKTELHRDILMRSDIFVEYRAADADRGRDPAARPRPSGDGVVAGSDRPGAGAAGRATGHAVRRRRLRDRGFFRPALHPRPASPHAGVRQSRPARRPGRSPRPLRDAAAAQADVSPSMLLSGEDLEQLSAWRKALHRDARTVGRGRRDGARGPRFLGPTAPDRIVENLGGHGVALVYESAAPGPTVLFRAELDALPIDEVSTLRASLDASGEGAFVRPRRPHGDFGGGGGALAARRPKRGRVVLLFQPAEEDGSGAEAVVADPKFSEIRPDFCSPCTTCRALPLGRAALRAGPVACASAASRSF